MTEPPPEDPGRPEAPGPGAALEAAVAAAQASPLDINAALHAASLLFEAGEPARAVAFARAAVAVDPANHAALRTLSGLLDATGERAEAIRVSTEAVRLNPADAEIRLHLGAMLATERRWREAADHLSVHVVSSAVAPLGWRLLSSALHQAGAVERATEAARHAVTADPGNIEYRLNLASLLCHRGLHDQALDELYTALAMAPAAPHVWQVLSGVHAALNQLPEALGAAERAVVLAPGDEGCRAHLAFIAGLCAVPIPHHGLAGDPTAWSVPPRRFVPATHRREPSLIEDIATRWRVIFAIMRRDIRTRFGHTRLGYFWAIMEPIGHLMTLGTVFYALQHATPPIGENLFLFYITGLVPFLMFSHVSHDIMNSSDVNNAMMQLPIVKRPDLMVANGLRQFATELCVGAIIFSTAGIAGQRCIPADLLIAAAAIVSLWLLAIGIGAFNLVVVEMFPSYDTFYNALIRVLYVASGIYYSPIGMPEWVRDILVWNPILQGVEFFRSGFYPQYEPHWLDVGYLWIWIIASIGIGFALERMMRSRMVVHA